MGYSTRLNRPPRFGAGLGRTTPRKFLVSLLAPRVAPGRRPHFGACKGIDTVLDVGVASPGASGAGADCAEAMCKRKRRAYAAYEDELDAARVMYKPLVWSCFGREHAETTAALTTLARRAARRQGLSDYGPLLARARAAIGVALARRCARMVHACLWRPAPARLLPN